MPRLLVAGVVLYAAIAIYSFFDCAFRDRSLIKVLPKWAWLLVIILIPVVGIALWYLFGRVTVPKRSTRPIAPDDDPDYLDRISREMREERDREKRRQDRERPDDSAN